MKNKMIYLLFAIGAILLTAFLYLIDSDPAYTDFKKTAMEFSLIAVIIFGLFCAIRFIIRFIGNYLK